MPTPLNTRLSITKDELKTLLENYYWKENLNQKQIAEKLGCHLGCIENWWRRLKITSRSRKEQAKLLAVQKPNPTLTPHERNCLDGMLLSDLHIEQHVNVARLSFGFKYKEMSEAIVRELPSLSFNTPTYNAKTLGWHSKSQSTVDLLNLRQQWYKDRTKLVPPELELTPEAGYWWYLGDGMNTGHGLLLCTESFTRDDCERLSLQLNSFEIPCHVTPTNRIRIRGSSGTQAFLNWIGDCKTECYKYKWNK